MAIFNRLQTILAGKLDIGAVLIFLVLAFPLAAQERGGKTGDAEAGRALYQINCFQCHAEGDGIAGVDFRKGIRRASTDEEISKIILGGIPGTGMPPTNFPPESSDLSAVIAYLRSMREAGVGLSGVGDADRGRALFEGKGGCLGCHRVAGNGSYLGPDLSEVGAARTPVALEHSILDPGDTVLPQNKFVRAVTSDGTVLIGRRLNEDTHTVELIDEHERLISLRKSDLREYTVLKTSSMPSFRGKLSSQEITDIITYLSSQKGFVNP